MAGTTWSSRRTWPCWPTRCSSPMPWCLARSCRLWWEDTHVWTYHSICTWWGSKHVTSLTYAVCVCVCVARSVLFCQPCFFPSITLTRKSIAAHSFLCLTCVLLQPMFSVTPGLPTNASAAAAVAAAFNPYLSPVSPSLMPPEILPSTPVLMASSPTMSQVPNAAAAAQKLLRTDRLEVMLTDYHYVVLFYSFVVLIKLLRKAYNNVFLQKLECINIWIETVLFIYIKCLFIYCIYISL